MREVHLPKEVEQRLKRIYEQMEAAYDQAAAELQFSCSGCPDNCCDSYFLHHTYIEWAYLWLGFSGLPPEKQKEVLDRARNYIVAAERELSRNGRPQILCPLNENGLCILYEYRMMVCRTHGVPAALVRPDGRKMDFPGCFRCQERVAERIPGEKEIRVDRTRMLQQLAHLENELLDSRRHLFPRVKLTIAEMLVKGSPVLPDHCRR